MRHTAAGTGGGFFSDLVWIDVEYVRDGPREHAPEKLVLKRPRTQLDPVLIYRYEREVRYYQHFADSGPLRVPACYYAQFDPESGNFALLLEDLSSLSAGDQLTGCSLQEAECAVAAVARLHAAFMGDTSVEQKLCSSPLPWRPPGAEAWLRLREDFAGAIPPPAIDLTEVLANGGMATVLELMRQAPQTLIHGDFRLDNMLFGPGPDGSSASLVLLDWQMTRQDTGPADLAWFLATSIEPEQRRAWERSLLTYYCDELTRLGVTGASFEDCLRQYRLGLMRSFASAALGHLISSGGPEAHKKMDLMVQRAATAVADTDCLSLLKASMAGQ
jgi:hypothetical protein